MDPKEKNCNGLCGWVQSHFWGIFIALVIIGASSARLGGLSFKSGDYYDLLVWFTHFTNNGFAGFKTIYTETNAQYPPLFMFIYAFMSRLPQPSQFYTIFYMKFPQMLVDFTLAFVVYQFVEKFRGEKKWGILAASAFLLAPLPLLNSGTWGQVDVLYSCAAIFAAYLLFREKYQASFWLLGVAFALKPHTMFIFPLFILMVFHKKINPLYFMLIPLPHILVSAFVALVWKAPFIKTLSVLLTQSPGAVSRGATNFAALINYPSVNTMAFLWLLALTVTTCAVLLHLFLLRTKPLNWDKFILWSLVTTLTVTCFLPNMHDRFFFLPETFSLIYAFMKPKYFYISLMIHLASLSSYSAYLFGVPIFPYAALLMLSALCLLFVILHREEFTESSNT